MGCFQVCRRQGEFQEATELAQEYTPRKQRAGGWHPRGTSSKVLGLEGWSDLTARSSCLWSKGLCKDTGVQVPPFFLAAQECQGFKAAGDIYPPQAWGSRVPHLPLWAQGQSAETKPQPSR